MKQSKELKQELERVCACKDEIAKVSEKLVCLRCKQDEICDEIKQLEHMRASLLKHKDILQKGIAWAEGKK
jgi:uncharacterized membrane protein